MLYSLMWAFATGFLFMQIAHEQGGAPWCNGLSFCFGALAAFTGYCAVLVLRHWQREKDPEIALFKELFGEDPGNIEDYK